MPWQMFHYNSQHRGQSYVNGPQTYNLKWTYTQSDITEGTVPNSISIDSSGTLYVTAANKLLAIDSDGNCYGARTLAGLERLLHRQTSLQSMQWVVKYFTPLVRPGRSNYGVLRNRRTIFMVNRMLALMA